LIKSFGEERRLKTAQERFDEAAGVGGMGKNQKGTRRGGRKFKKQEKTRASIAFTETGTEGLLVGGKIGHSASEPPGNFMRGEGESCGKLEHGDVQGPI